MRRPVLDRAVNAVANRVNRRSFLARSALIGSALVTAPGDLLLRPQSAYASICSCLGQSCTCGSLCCDGYTEFCCALYGVNGCPTGSLVGGWWKADGSSYCGGKARYYMDCHNPCGACTCGSSGLCSGSCNGTACGCGLGRCDYRKAGCTSFRYGNCNNATACIGPIQCRIVTCTAPWLVDNSCSSVDTRTDNNTASHNRSCLQTAPPIYPVAGNWDGVSIWGIGFYDNRNAQWSLRQSANYNPIPTFWYGMQAGDIPVVGDWNGDGKTSVAIFRNDSRWHISDTINPATTVVVTQPWGQTEGDLPVAGDWDGDGKDSPGIFRKGGYWLLSNALEHPVVVKEVRYGLEVGDVPVVGDWNNDGIDGIGIFRHGEWHLNNEMLPGATARLIYFGQAGDLPVVGDWFGVGADSLGFYRPSEGTWYLRTSLDDPTFITVKFGQQWLLG